MPLLKACYPPIHGTDSNIHKNNDISDLDYDNSVEQTDSEEDSSIDEDNFNKQVRADPNYVQHSSVPIHTTHSSTNNSSMASVEKSFNVSSLKDIPPIDNRKLVVPPSKTNEKKTHKQYFYPYCKKLVTACQTYRNCTQEEA